MRRCIGCGAVVGERWTLETWREHRACRRQWLSRVEDAAKELRRMARELRRGGA